MLPSQSDHPVAALPNIMAIVAMVHKAHSATFFPAEPKTFCSVFLRLMGTDLVTPGGFKHR